MVEAVGAPGAARNTPATPDKGRCTGSADILHPGGVARSYYEAEGRGQRRADSARRWRAVLPHRLPLTVADIGV